MSSGEKSNSSGEIGGQPPTIDRQDETAKSPTDKASKWFWGRYGEKPVGRLLAVALVASAIVGWLTNQYQVLEKVRAVLKTPTTYATSDEITCLNEWVLKLAGENTSSAAEQTRAKFLDDYRGFGHVNYLNQPIWQNDIHVVRDPTHVGEWLVVIDMYPGASTRECMEAGKEEMVAVLDAKPADVRREWENRIGRSLRPAEPLCYDLSEFEKANGKILNTSSDVQHQRSLGSCAAKLHNPQGFSCTEGR